MAAVTRDQTPIPPAIQERGASPAIRLQQRLPPAIQERGTNAFMAKKQIFLALGGGVFTGGAQFKAADESGLPSRVTIEDDYTPIQFSDPYDGWCWDPDGQHIWMSRYTQNDVIKIDIFTGNIIVTTPMGTAVMGLWRYDNTNFYVTDYNGSQLFKMRFSDGAIVATTPCSLTNPGFIIVPQGTVDKAWVITYPSSVLTEITLSTGVVTGRSVGTGPVQDAWASVEGGTTYLYLQYGASLEKFDEPTLTSQATWLPSLDSGTYPGHLFPGYFSGFSVTPSGQPLIYEALAGRINLWADSGGIGPAFPIASGTPELRGSSGGGAVDWTTKPIFSDNFRYLGFTSTNSLGGLAYIRVVNVQLQRALYTQTFTEGGTLREISVPGYFGTSWDGGRRDLGDYRDQRRVRFYYVLDGGPAVEFLPGAPLAVNFSNGSVLDVRVDFLETTLGTANAPFIAGAGVALLYDPQNASGGPGVKGGINFGRFNQGLDTL